MRSSASTKSLAVLVSLLLVLTVVPGVAAAETRSGGAVVVEEGETVNGDLEAFGGSVVVRGTVTGDLSAFGGDVRIEGRVGGDVEAFGGNVALARGSSVGGNVETAAGNVVVAGSVGGNVGAAAETVTIGPGAEIGGDLEAGAEVVRLASGSSIAGDVTYDGRLDRADDASVAGTVTRDEGVEVGGPFAGEAPVIPGWVGDVYGFLANAALGAVLLLAFPAFSRAVSSRATGSPLRSGGGGLLALIAVPLALVVVAITIVGIPLSLLGALLFGVGLWVGAVYGRIAVGDWLLGYAGVTNRWLGLLVGLLVVAVGVRLPVIGGVVEFLVLLLGFGALASALVERYRSERGAASGGPGVGEESEARPA